MAEAILSPPYGGYGMERERRIEILTQDLRSCTAASCRQPLGFPEQGKERNL